MNIVTVGNNSYINLVDLALTGNHGQTAKTILETISDFEKNNPKKNVVGWSMERVPSAVFGIWVHHKPKWTLKALWGN